MSLVATIVWVLAVQQLTVTPCPGIAGEPVVVSLRLREAPLAGVEFVVEAPDGTTRSCGATGADGKLRFVPEAAGHHVFGCTVDGVRQLLPLAVNERFARWPLAIASVPLGLALLWWNLSRARGRRAL